MPPILAAPYRCGYQQIVVLVIDDVLIQKFLFTIAIKQSSR
jgi:hypothetical protein